MYSLEYVNRLNAFLEEYAQQQELRAMCELPQEQIDKLLLKAERVRMQSIPTWPKLY